MTLAGPAPAGAEPALATERGARPAGVWVVAVAVALVAAGLAYALFTNPPEDPTILVILVALLAMFLYVDYAFWKGEGWARSLLLALSFGALALAVVALVVAAGDGKIEGAWKTSATLALVSAAIAAYLLTPEIARWIPAVNWRESFSDVKWAISLLFLTMLALFGYNNQAWSHKPPGRESLARLTDLFLTGDAKGLGTDLPLMFLLQLLGILLVAALIASVVIAIRDPAPGEREDVE